MFGLLCRFDCLIFLSYRFTLTSAKPGWTPIRELNGVLSLDGCICGIDGRQF
ncbi:hypothetical protein ES319_D01G010700v1 [Gossypium barbadense]|uniref:Uncharacterized protein n=2 Tax=Gossypium TaxID=3633 RepID=A0A5J5SIN7_GOSBA|nr:hypothetical protein ES319_D01G010700v1 [Gossypium barbadense]TYG81522.1 hypothetical protein ES288_D01G011800v1 [Gossypium darwinii]